MQLSSFFIAAFLPVGLLAAPAADGTDNSHMYRSPAVAPSPLEPRYQMCAIVGATDVHCRTGPGTNYKSAFTVPKGNKYAFTCVKTGQCLTINGATNWYGFCEISATYLLHKFGACRLTTLC
jgi:hypothetical protein